MDGRRDENGKPLPAWSKEAREFAIERARAGDSASIIKLGLWQKFRVLKSRNAIIGIVHRAGAALGGGNQAKRLGGRKTARRIKAAQQWRPLSKVAALFAAEPMPPPEPELVIPEHERKTLMQLEDRDCRWGIGDPRKPDFHFCARPQVSGLPYCERHARRAYQPPIPRQSRASPANQGLRTGGPVFEDA